MSIEEKRYKYEQLRGLILESKQVRDLVVKRDQEIDHLRHKQSSSYYMPGPKLTPKGDISIPKTKQLSDELRSAQRENIQKTRETYDQKIYDTAKEHFEKEGHNNFDDLKDIGGLNEKEVGILVEKNGVSKLTDSQKEKDLPTYLTDEKYEQIYKEKRDDFSKNKQDIDKVPRKEVVQFDHNQKDIGKQIQFESSKNGCQKNGCVYE